MKFTNNDTIIKALKSQKIIFDNNYSLSKKIDLIYNNLSLIETINQRIRTLKLFRTFLKNHRLNLTKLINIEAFKTETESKGEFDYALEFVEYSINLLSKYKFEIKTSSKRSILLKSSGSVFAITPYNDPLAGMTRKIAPAIASGSPLVMKTSSYCINLCKYFDKNLPKEIKKILQFAFIKNKNLIDKIVQNKKIKVLTFTGSTNIGLKLNNIQTDHLQKKILELGGINYAIIFDKHNLENVVDEILVRKYKAAGQACSSINKLFVHKDIKNDFERILTYKINKLQCGSVENLIQPDFGPLISTSHYNFCKKLESKSLKKGKLLARSKNKKDTNNLFPLTIINTKIDDDVFDKEETFGPLLGVSYFSNNDLLIKKISNSDYSLVCYFFTNNSKIIKSVKKLNFGSIGINTTKIQSPASPTGGNNLSGIGREGGIWGFQEFLTTVNYVINK